MSDTIDEKTGPSAMIELEGSYARFVRGQADDPLFVVLKDRVPALADAAWAACESAPR